MRSFAAAVISIGMCGAAMAQEVPAAPDPAQSEIDVATANTALMKTGPKWVSGVQPEFPDSEKALGHNGGVILRGVLGVDGKLSHVSVAQSSLAPALDDSALKAASAQVYSPGKNADGVAMPVVMEQEFRFDNYRSSSGVGAAKYMCRQFVLDMDWWKQAHAKPNYRDHQFYTMTRGLGGIVRIRKEGGRITGFESNESFDKRWEKAIETCRAKPEKRFADAIKPEGDYILNLEKNIQN